MKRTALNVAVAAVMVWIAVVMPWFLAELAKRYDDMHADIG